MKLNRAEKALMNNAVRSWIQRHYEAPLLTRLGGRLDGGRAVEVGCGRGVGTEIILEQFGAAHVLAVDLDPGMVDLARDRLARFGDRVDVRVGDATAIPAADDSVDAVFDFGIIHHIPDWRAALADVGRVLRAGGRFYFEEVTRHALERWTYRTFLEHPDHDRFSAEQFVAGVEEHGMKVADTRRTVFFSDFVVGVGVAV